MKDDFGFNWFTLIMIIFAGLTFYLCVAIPVEIMKSRVPNQINTSVSEL